MQAQVDEKQAELARMQVELDSLLRVEHEQGEAIARLSNNESGL